MVQITQVAVEPLAASARDALDPRATIPDHRGVIGGPAEVETAGAEITLEPDGTIVIRVKAVHMTEDLMAGVLEGRFSLGRRRAPVLVDTRRVLSMTRKAQELTAAPSTLPYTDCIALLVDKPVTVVLVNVFMVLVRPPYPTKMFRAEPAARAWLARARSDHA